MRVGLAWMALGPLLIALFLQACAAPSATGRRENSYPGSGKTGSTQQGESEEVGKPPFPFAPPKPLDEEPTPPPSYPKSAAEISGQAVVTLMRQANEASAAGQYDLAASHLERAQRIEPRNYFVWSALAKIYLRQDEFDQAISVAGKSNSLARGNVYVELENWKIIAAARQARGDSIGALQAQARVDEIERKLGGG